MPAVMDCAARMWRKAGAEYPGHQPSPEHGMASRFRRRGAAS